MSKSVSKHRHLTLSQVKQVIQQTFIKQAFKKHMHNVVNKNAQQKIPPESVNYANSIMQKLVNASEFRPNEQYTQREEHCLNPTTDVIRVKLVKKSKFRNSSIESRDSKHKKPHSQYRIFNDRIIEGSESTHLHVPLNKRSQSSNSSIFAQQRQSPRIMKHQRTQTQSNCKDGSGSHCNLQKLLLPVTTTQSATDRQNSMKSYINLQLDHHIQSLRNRKLKLEAAFINFGANDQNNIVNKDKENQGEKKIPLVPKREPDGQFKTIVTDYDGQVINSAPIQKLKKVNVLNKENFYAAGSFAPTVRIKTEVSSNFMQVNQNVRTFKGTVKGLKNSTNKKLVQSMIPSSALHSYTSESTLKKGSFSSMEQRQGKSGGTQRKQNKEKQTKNDLFAAVNLVKSKRVLQKEGRSQKKITFGQEV